MVSNQCTVLIPVYDDWVSADLLLERLDRVLQGAALAGAVVLVDDGSTEQLPPDFACRRFSAIRAVEILHLHRNLGHQRAIAVGLVHVHREHPDNAVLIMDSDGEDRPEDVLTLFDEFWKWGGSRIVFAARGKRLEHLPFRFFYHLYRLLHYLLVGIKVRVGNFSVAPPAMVASLVLDGDIWNHYAAAVFRARLPRQTVSIARGQRYAGYSKMNFTGLLLHGLTAISVFGDIVAVRLLAFSVVVILGALLTLAVIVVVRIDIGGGAGDWSTIAAGLMLILLFQMTNVALFAFATLSRRTATSFVPLRDALVYIRSVETIYSRPVQSELAGTGT